MLDEIRSEVVNKREPLGGYIKGLGSKESSDIRVRVGQEKNPKKIRKKSAHLPPSGMIMSTGTTGFPRTCGRT
jgi:hypothetical protein